ncbi:LOW QUALITY PROTEIN: hypothetical protein ACHAWF_008047 [Thalassiosira exigua]
MVSLSIKRVVSVFILRPNKSHPGKQRNGYQLALFHRCDTMPTFPGHWAGISGSIEDDDANPFEAAVRELQEEKNLIELFDECCDGDDGMTSMHRCIKQGLHVDVSSGRSKGAFGGRIIRVYPLALTLPGDNLSAGGAVHKNKNQSLSPWSNLQMKGTEHDQIKFFDIKSEFLTMTEPCVPLLKDAFHHATSGSYLELPNDVRSWEQDRVNGAAFLAWKAVTLAAAHTGVVGEHNDSDGTERMPNMALSIAMLRPSLVHANSLVAGYSMVPIVNVMNEFHRPKRGGMRQSEERANAIIRYRCRSWRFASKGSKFVIGTFSRSSTMKLIMISFLQAIDKTTQVQVLCSQSTPGDEGELMAGDIPRAKWLPDDNFQHEIRQKHINLVLVGADCILPEGKGVVNKVGTATLARACKQSKVPIICCADRSKLWDDDYPPGLEEIFELVDSNLLDQVLVPAGGSNEQIEFEGETTD